MKRLVPLALLCVGFLAGYAVSLGSSAAVHAQAGGGARGQAQAPRVHPTKSLYWSSETLKQGHLDAVARTAGRAGVPPSPVTVRTPNLNMSLNHRQHRDAPRVSNGAKVNSVWDDAESHEGNYDFYVIVGGTGEVVVDGPMENNIRINSLDVPGEFRGQPIANGTTYRVKEGDWLLIPPNVRIGRNQTRAA